MGGLGDVFANQESLTGSGFIGTYDTGKNILYAIGKIMGCAGGNFFDKLPFFLSETIRFEVDIVNPDGIFPFPDVAILSRADVVSVKRDVSRIENGQAGKYGHVFMQKMVGIGGKAFYNLLGRQGIAACGELLQTTEISFKAVQVVEQFIISLFILAPAELVEKTYVIG